jgi:hypothetical protein
MPNEVAGSLSTFGQQVGLAQARTTGAGDAMPSNSGAVVEALGPPPFSCRCCRQSLRAPELVLGQRDDMKSLLRSRLS